MSDNVALIQKINFLTTFFNRFKTKEGCKVVFKSQEIINIGESENNINLILTLELPDGSIYGMQGNVKMFERLVDEIGDNDYPIGTKELISAINNAVTGTKVQKFTEITMPVNKGRKLRKI